MKEVIATATDLPNILKDIQSKTAIEILNIEKIVPDSEEEEQKYVISYQDLDIPLDLKNEVKVYIAHDTPYSLMAFTTFINSMKERAILTNQKGYSILAASGLKMSETTKGRFRSAVIFYQEDGLDHNHRDLTFPNKESYVRWIHEEFAKDQVGSVVLYEEAIPSQNLREIRATTTGQEETSLNFYSVIVGSKYRLV